MTSKTPFQAFYTYPCQRRIKVGKMATNRSYLLFIISQFFAHLARQALALLSVKCLTKTINSRHLSVCRPTRNAVNHPLILPFRNLMHMIRSIKSYFQEFIVNSFLHCCKKTLILRGLVRFSDIKFGSSFFFLLILPVQTEEKLASRRKAPLPEGRQTI